GGLVDLLRFDDLAFEQLHLSGLNVQFILRLLQQLLFMAQGGGYVRELLCEFAGGQLSQQPSDHAADSCRDEKTSHDLADEYDHWSLTPFTRNSMRRSCWRPTRVCATDSGREAP